MSRLTPPAHPLLGVAQGGPRPAWESRLDLRLSPYLADHRVQHAAIMPATAYLELAFAAGREAFGAVGCELRDVKLANPCFLAPDEPLRLQTTFDPDTATVQVHTRPIHGDREWTVHLTATLASPPGRVRRGRVLARRDPASLPARVLPGSVLRVPRRDRPGLRPDVPGHRTGLAGGPRIARAGPCSPTPSNRTATSICSTRPCSTPASRRSSRPTRTSTGVTAACTCRMRSSRSGSSAGRAVACGSTPACWRRRRAGRSRTSTSTTRTAGSAARVRGLRSHRVAGGREESLDDLLYAYQWRPQPLRSVSPRWRGVAGRSHRHAG